MKIINTLEKLAEFINTNDEWNLEVEDIIKENGWVSDCDTKYGICHSGNKYLELNEDAEAIIILR